MIECTYIGCHNEATTQVKEKETQNMLWVCKEHEKAINEMVIQSYTKVNES